MDIQGSNTYQELFRQDAKNNLESLFPLAQKCIQLSSNEKEVLKALQITFEFGSILFSLDKLEKEFLQNTCPVAKKIFFRNLENVEKFKENLNHQIDKTESFQFLENCTQIISYFSMFFTQVNNYQKVTLLQVESLLISCTEILRGSFCHCNNSEKIYQSMFESVSTFLAAFFKESCRLLELLLIFLSNNMSFDSSADIEISILCEILDWLSEFAMMLMNLDVKIMANVWKTLVSLIEKYITFIRKSFSINNIISSLSESIIFNVADAVEVEDNEEFSRKIKLACFNLKLVIKFCELFNGQIAQCQKLLVKLLLTLCGISQLEVFKFKNFNNKELLKQLSFGALPLLSQLIGSKELVDEFVEISHNIKHQKDQLDSFLMLCCQILNKLMEQNDMTRNIWLKRKNNIFDWLFESVALNQYNVCLIKELPDVIIGGEIRKINDFYQYILIAISSFAMTSTSKEFFVIEKILIKYVLQPKPLCALLAIDIWCLIARFATSDLCFSQIFNLCSILNEFKYETYRTEKYYLIFLIERLYCLLTLKHRKLFNETFNLSTSSKLWNSFTSSYPNNDLNLHLIDDINSSYWSDIEKFTWKSDTANASSVLNWEETLIQDSNLISRKTFENQLVRLWTFDITYLLNYRYNEKFLRILCLLTAQATKCISPENMLKILSKMKELLVDQSISFPLFFLPLLNSLSAVSFPLNNFQQKIIGMIADIFGALLQWEKILLKEKAFESFYNFSHTTNHPEIIAFSVNQSHGLKDEVTNYFKKLLSPERNFNINDFIISLCKINCEHVCYANSYNNNGNNIVDNEWDENKVYKKDESPVKVNYEGNVSKKDDINANTQKIIEIWKKNVEDLIGMSEQFTNMQKKEIVEVCAYLLDKFR